MLLAELVWRGSMAHVEDLFAAARVSGERNVDALVWALLNNLSDVLLALLLGGIALYRTRSLVDLLFYGLCLLGGVLILSQNAHSWGIITLFAAAAVAAETLLRRGELRRAFTGAPLLFLLMVLPAIPRQVMVLLTYSGLAFGNFGVPLGLPNFADVRFGRIWSAGDNGFTELYIGSFPEGVALLEGLDQPPERVLVLDFSNPFTAGMGLQPPRGDLSWMHWGRNIDGTHYLPPEQLFGDAAIVMVPEIGINSAQLENLYGLYLDTYFDLARKTEGWKVYRARKAP